MAYVTQVVEVDVTDLVRLRQEVKDFVFAKTGVKLTYLPFIAKAACLALQEFPVLTATYDESTQELVYPGTLNLGFAVDTAAGLMVPNVKNAHTLSVLQLAAEISRLARDARDRKLSGGEMNGGHFTVTNYGSAGAIFGTPVIKFPEIAILGVGAITSRLNVYQREAHYLYLTVAADHRWVDGVLIANFANTVKKYLQQPAVLGVF